MTIELTLNSFEGSHIEVDRLIELGLDEIILIVKIVPLRFGYMLFDVHIS